MKQGTGWSLVTADRIVNDGPTLLYSVSFFSDEGEGEVNIYDGLDSGAGRLCIPMIEADGFIGQLEFIKPLRLMRGLYADMGSKMDAVLIQWEALVDD